MNRRAYKTSQESYKKYLVNYKDEFVARYGIEEYDRTRKKYNDIVKSREQNTKLRKRK